MLTVSQAADRAGIDPSRIRRMIASGQLRASRFSDDGKSGPWMISPTELERFMATPRPRGVNLGQREKHLSKPVAAT